MQGDLAPRLAGGSIGDARADDISDDLRRRARVVGLGSLDVPTLEAVERRRMHLWVATTILLVAVALATALVSVWVDLGADGLLTPTMTRLAILGLVAGFCAYSLEKEQHLRRLTRMLVEERVLSAALTNRLRELESLHAAGRAVNSVLEPDEVLRIILGSATELLDARGGSVMLREDERELRAVCVRGNEHAHGVRVLIGEGVAGRVAETREPLLINGEVDEEEFPGRTPRVRPVASAMSVPLLHRGELLGVLNVNALPSRTFTQYDLRALSLFGEQAASAIANARLYEAERHHASELAHQAFHDDLTGIANRALFADRLEHAMRRSARSGETLAVLFLDLDDFKRVNDSLGHAAGDHVLTVAAHRLQAQVRSIDTVARFGGDEFVVLLEDLANADEAVLAAERVLSALRSPVEVRGRRVGLRAAVGVAVATPGDTPDDVLRNADVAMYIAKDHGKDCIRVFEPNMHRAVLARLELEADIERAIELGQLVVHYQPVVDLRTCRVVGVEALVRWDHPARGRVLPGAFVPLAEQTGLVVPIDRWVLETACRQAGEWRERHPDMPPLGVSVNLSTRSLEQEDIVQVVARVLEDAAMDPALLTVEITESFVLQDREASVGRLAELRRLGVRLAIDDFGTGWSSLSYLKQLPVDILKIDRSFIDGLGRGDEDAALVRAIVKLGHSLHLRVVAEGIEREDQLEELRRLRCALGQGFHFSPALTAAAIEPFLVSGFAGAVLDGGSAAARPTPAAATGVRS